MNTPRRPLVLIVIAVAALSLGAGGWFWRSARARAEVLAHAVPGRPDFAGWPEDLARRVNSCEQRLAAGREPLAALGELSRLYHANGFFEEAAQCYDALVRLDPGEPRWLHRLASIQAGLGELPQAIPLWQRAAKLAPTYAPVHVRLGDALVKNGTPAEAREHYDAVLKRQPRHPYALLGVARCEIAAGHWPRAREPLEIAAAETGSGIGGDLLVTVYEQLGDTLRATALRGRTKASGAFYDIPDPWLDEMFLDCYDNYRVLIAAGTADHGGDPATSIRLLDRALLLAPEYAPAYLQYGILLKKQRAYDQARARFEQCLKLAPDLSDGWAQLHDLLLTVGRNDEADRVLAQGLARCPESAGLRLGHARRLAKLGSIEAAVTEYREVIRRRPEEAEAYVGLARLLLTQGKEAEGVALIERAQLAEPDHPYVLLLMAVHSIQQGEEKAASAWLQRAANQPRVPRDDLDPLLNAFRQKFGHAPW